MTETPWWVTERPGGRPLPVEGGIKARTQRGAIGRSWWSARFVQVLETIGVGGRLGRGRSYARSGQVISLETTAGAVQAEVQGSRPRPYKVRIGLPTFGKTEWARVEQAMADSAWYAAKLLAGEMPEDIEDVFTSVGLALFPSSVRELSLDCACPDHQVPCKHLAAVFYLLAESFDADPFAMLALRGRDRETLLENIRARRTSAPAGSGQSGGEQVDPGQHVAPLADCLDDFFRPAARLPPLAAPATPPDAVLDQLPSVRLRVRDQELADLLRPVYRALADPE
ncbi:MAG TPA: SWIM zinc finger family protein [Pseudonocardia sp.]|uniref:SWIM zinc finger family protein n=1 Tax=Pseudonocardia sp. TaxID=60912 RepID=UPI002D17126D|nr:SWIM zinc finger family protein [Pseudonocardia sp.]HTF51155.1 SWIM zinc finger family protein [Pseudonocardia sp.]